MEYWGNNPCTICFICTLTYFPNQVGLTCGWFLLSLKDGCARCVGQMIFASLLGSSSVPVRARRVNRLIFCSCGSTSFHVSPSIPLCARCVGGMILQFYITCFHLSPNIPLCIVDVLAG